LAYRLQERAEGGVSPATLARLVELVPSLQAVRQERKTQPSRAAVASAPGVVRDPRLPDVGTLLRRPYQGKVHEVEVLAQGFRFRGKVHGSLSSIARVITGTNWNGFVFFGLVGRKEQP